MLNQVHGGEGGALRVRHYAIKWSFQSDIGGKLAQSNQDTRCRRFEIDEIFIRVWVVRFDLYLGVSKAFSLVIVFWGLQRL